LSGRNRSPIEVDVTDGRETALFQCGPCIHVSLLEATPRDGVAPSDNATTTTVPPMSGLTVLGVCVCIVASALASSFARWPAPLRDRAAQPPDGQQAHAHGEKAQDIVHCLSSDPLLTGTVRLAVAGATPEPRDTVLRQTTVSELASNQTAENLLFHVAPITCWGRQIHRGNRIVRRSPAQRLLDFGPTLYPPPVGPESSSGTTTRHGYCALVAGP
jgi:hypothetical protein